MASEQRAEPTVEYDESGLVKGVLCPNCRDPLKLDHADDIGTRFYKCEKCGEQTSKPKTTEQEQLKTHVLDVEIEANRILDSPGIEAEIQKHLDNLIAGEKNNKLSLFITLLSGKFPDSRMKQMVLIKGTQGAGKSVLMRVADLFKVKDVGRFSEHALDYTELEGYDVLRLKEIGHMDEEKQGTSTIKFLSADDKGYNVEVVVKDKETHRFKTEVHTIPPITVLSSTTRIVLDPQYMRRNWIFNPDESEEQTRTVNAWTARLEREKAELALGARPYTSYDFSEKILKRLVEKLSPCDVIIPFPETITEVLNTKVLRTRGDYPKLLAFLKLHAFLAQKRLPKVQKEGLIVFVTPESALEALKIIQAPLTAMISNLEDRTRRLIQTFKERGFEKGSLIAKSDRETIAVSLGKAEKTIRSYLGEWETAGYVSSTDTKPKNFTLLYDLDYIEKKNCNLSAKLESANDLISQMQKEALEWFNRLSENLTPTDGSNLLDYYKRPLVAVEVKVSDSHLTDSKTATAKSGLEHWQKSILPESEGDKKNEPCLET